MWSELLYRPDVMIVDTETTGMDSDDEVVEIAVIDTIGQVRLNEVIMPKVDVSVGATQQHGLTRKVLGSMGAKNWGRHHDRIGQLLGSAEVVFAYNVEFDQQRIDQSARANGLPVLHGVTWRCLMKEYAQWRGGRTWSKLPRAYAREIDVSSVKQEHRALPDCYMCLGLMTAVSAKHREVTTSYGRDMKLEQYITGGLQEGWRVESRRVVLTGEGKRQVITQEGEGLLKIERLQGYEKE